MRAEIDKYQIDSIIAGEHNLFSIFIEKYKRLVSHIVFRMVNNKSDREDLCQDVFVKIYSNLASFQYKSKLSTWVAKIAYNTCINYLQKKKVTLLQDMDTDEEEREDVFQKIVGNNHTPLDWTESRDLSSCIHSEIVQLAPVYRTIVTLFHIDEMSYNEIGEIMDLPEGTVKSYLFRARKLLRDRLMATYPKEALWQ